MALVIRLTTTGKRGERKFRVVVAEKRSRKEGRPIDMLGWYIKTEKGITKKIDVKKAQGWIAKGAKPSATVAALLK